MAAVCAAADTASACSGVSGFFGNAAFVAGLAAALMGVLKGIKGPYRDIAVLNAAAAMVVSGKAKDLKIGAAMAAKSLDSGEAEGRLGRLVAVSNAS